MGTSDKEKMRREQGELGKDIMLEVEDDKILEESPQEINYLRRHCLKEISERTLAYLSDCPIKLTLHIMKDYNEECLHSSFNESYGSEMDVTSEHSTSKDLSSNLDQSTVSHQTHQTESPVR